MQGCCNDASSFAHKSSFASSPPLLQTYITNSPLGKSGCLAAFALIFLSELGDKTFFIAALLAMRVGKWLSFTGSVAALSLMTLISVGIGVVFKNVPDQFSSSIPIGQYLGIAFLVYFGLKTLKVWTLVASAFHQRLALVHTLLSSSEFVLACHFCMRCNAVFPSLTSCGSSCALGSNQLSARLYCIQLLCHPSLLRHCCSHFCLCCVHGDSSPYFTCMHMCITLSVIT